MLSMALSVPRWNTHFVREDSHQITFCRAALFRLDGLYRYYMDVLPGNLEQLKLEMMTRDIVWMGYGWVIRHLMVLRDNYFGGFTHFSTLYEHLNKRRRGAPPGDPVHLQYRPGEVSNPSISSMQQFLPTLLSQILFKLTFSLVSIMELLCFPSVSLATKSSRHQRIKKKRLSAHVLYLICLIWSFNFARTQTTWVSMFQLSLKI
jgi:hypothetical protein